MPELLCEGIAFLISLVAFLYGVFKLYTQRSPFYFKMIINAVGCYVLEELWVIVSTICDFNSGQLSVRLIGIFGCYCTFLAANLKGLDKIIDDGDKKNKPARLIGVIAPVVFCIAFVIFCLFAEKMNSVSHIIIPFIVLLPAIIDSYFELKCLVIPNDEMGFVKFVRPVNVLVLIEYAISVSYLFISSGNALNILNLASAIVMTLIVLECRKGAIKWKTLI